MGRGGGGGGGSRSSGGGGSSRSFGGSSSRSSSHRGGYTGGSSSHSSSSYRSSSPSYHNHSHGHSSVHVHNHYGGYGYGGYRSPMYLRPSFFFQLMAVIFAVAIVLVILFGDSVSGVSDSTIEREPLKPYAAFQKNAWDDRADWLSDSGTLNRGMERFYKETGVQPALAIVEDIDGMKWADVDYVEAFCTEEYDRLIGHERGILLLFCEWEPSDYDVYYMAGEDAQTVMDSEACDILMDYVHAYYTSDRTEDEYFGDVFADTGKRIMTVTPTVASRIPMVLGAVVVIALLFAALKALSMKHKRERERAEETERILNTPNERL